MSEFILKLSNISKSFGGVKVLENVSFDVEKGSRHALMDLMVLVKQHYLMLFLVFTIQRKELFTLKEEI